MQLPLIVKYAPDGRVLWSDTSPNSESREFWQFALDRTGNAYTVAYDGLGTLLKFGTDTGFEWAQPLGLNVDGHVATDDHDDVIVSGSLDFTPLWYLGTYIRKYSPDGTLLWTRHYAGQLGDDFRPSHCMSDASANMWLAGTTRQDLLVLKYSPDGDLLWTWRYDGPANGYDNLNSAHLDRAGNLFIQGESAVATAEDPYFAQRDLMLWKLSPDGRVLWHTQYGDPRYSEWSSGGIMHEQSGTIANGALPIVVTFDSETGRPLWERAPTMPGGRGVPGVAAWALPGGGVLTGILSFERPTGNGDWGPARMALSKFDSDGNELWCYFHPEDANVGVAAISGSSLYLNGDRLIKLRMLAAHREGDANGDGIVDDADLTQMILDFGRPGGASDVNDDGMVDEADLSIALINYGLGAPGG